MMVSYAILLYVHSVFVTLQYKYNHINNKQLGIIKNQMNAACNFYSLQK